MTVIQGKQTSASVGYKKRKAREYAHKRTNGMGKRERGPGRRHKTTNRREWWALKQRDQVFDKD
jgi:hypothetical protein